MRWLLPLLFCLLAASNCGGKVVVDGNGEGGDSSGQGNNDDDDDDDDGGGERCGDSICSAGQFCCNASCGLCAAEGEGCVTIACD
jgi:hypothetical protein